MTQAAQSIILTPTGRLRFEGGEDKPWQELWFRLGAKRTPQIDAVHAFWHGIGAACITALCHVAAPEADPEAEAAGIPSIPLPADAERWLASAPPLPGGEYLGLLMLQTLWQKLLAWCAEAALAKGGVAAFLKADAPQWSHVGRVFFHLAENKTDPSHPFAFLATYSTGLNDKGQPRHLPLANALKQYAQAKDKPALLRLLEPLGKAGQALPWVQKMLDTGAVYRPQPWVPRQALDYLKSAATLDACGIGASLPDWWRQRSRPKVVATVNAREGSALDTGALCDVDVRIAIGDETLSEKDLAALLAEAGSDGLVFFKGGWVELDREKLEQALSHWERIAEDAQKGLVSFADGMRLLAGYDAGGKTEDGEEEAVRTWSSPLPGTGFKEFLQSARTGAASAIPGLRATLRPYQAQGVAWLSFLGRLRLGACLADDMGLGKTIQVLALLLKERGGGPSLLVAPASLLGNWQAEAARFAPDLKLLLLHGMTRQEAAKFAAPHALDGYDLVLASYAGATGMPWMAKIAWKRIVADEAQAIKNAGTKQSRAVRALKAPARIALTGTPIENGLSDLWALFDFLNPGLLGGAREFAAKAKNMSRDAEAFAPLRRLTRPYILRRMKTDKSVIDSLPDKTEMPLECRLTPRQAAMYKAVTDRLAEALNEATTDESGKAKRRMIVLSTIMMLKQICNHPAQAGSGDAWDPALSGKFQAVGELCETIASRQEKLLVFSQFRETVEPLEEYLAGIFKARGLVMHGGVPVKKRQALVDAFQTPDGPPFMVLTIKVGGTGLTLTEASHVLHFDRWWNPAVEDQATDRAFRIGQKRNVLVHKCLVKGTVEEQIDRLIQDKRDLAGEVLGTGAEVNIASLSDEEIFKLVRLDASQVLA